RQLPLVLEEVLEEAVVPLRRGVGPRALKAARDRVAALAAAVLVDPAEALVLDARGFRLRADVGGLRRAVRLAERVAADDQRAGLLAVHRHAGEGLADVVGRRERIGLPAGALGVDVDEAHLHGAERLGEIAGGAVALVAEPRVLRSPEDVLGLPDVGPAEA